MLGIFASSCGKTTSDDPCANNQTGLADSACSTNTTGSTGAGSGAPLPQDLAPIPGSGPTFSSITPNSLVVSWTAATDVVTAAADIEYQLVSSASASALDNVETAKLITGDGIALAWSKNILSQAISNLPTAASRTFAVLARDEVGNIAFYPGETVSTLEPGAPRPGSDLTFSSITDSGYTVSWGAAISYSSSASNLEYRAVVASSIKAIDTVAEAKVMAGANVLFDWTKNRLSYTVTGVAGNTSSAVAILVRDEKGLVSIYTPALVTTKSHRQIFMTSSQYLPSSLSTSSAADAICNAQKPASRGQFKAMLVSSTRKACVSVDCASAGEAEHIDWVMAPLTSYENASGTLLWTTNVASIVPSNPTHPAIYPMAGNGIPVWTGIGAGWVRSSDTCLDWTTDSNSSAGFVGIANYTDSTAWTSLAIPCGQSKPIYCVEQ